MRLTLQFDTNYLTENLSEEEYTQHLENKKAILGLLGEEEKLVDSLCTDDNEVIHTLMELYDAQAAMHGTTLALCLWDIVYNLLRTKHVEDEKTAEIMDNIRDQANEMLEARGVADLVRSIP